MTISKKWHARVDGDEPVAKAAAVTLAIRLRTLATSFSRAAKPKSRAVEPVHQLRVATRRLDATLDLYAEFLPRRRTTKLQKLLKKIRRAAGRVRDEDMLLDRLADDRSVADAPHVIERIRRRRRSAHRELCELFQDRGKGRQGLAGQAKILVRKARRKSARRPKRASIRFADWAPCRLRDFIRDFFEAANPAKGDLAALHRFRIQAKSLRYGMELVADAFPPEFEHDLYPLIERLQSTLGQIHDETVFVETILKRLDGDASECERSVVENCLARERARIGCLEAEFEAWWTESRRYELKRGFERLSECVDVRGET